MGTLRFKLLAKDHTLFCENYVLIQPFHYDLNKYKKWDYKIIQVNTNSDVTFDYVDMYCARKVDYSQMWNNQSKYQSQKYGFGTSYANVIGDKPIKPHGHLGFCFRQTHMCRFVNNFETIKDMSRAELPTYLIAHDEYQFRDNVFFYLLFGPTEAYNLPVLSTKYIDLTLQLLPKNDPDDDNTS